MSVIDKVGGRNFITYNGVTKSVPKWAEELKVEIKTITRRDQRGWSVHEVLFGRKRRVTASTPMRKIYLAIGDKKLSITQWAEELGVPRERLYSRYRRGMSPMEVLAPVPRKETIEPISYRGITKTLAEWAEKFGVKYSMVYNRYKRGHSGESIVAYLYQQYRKDANDIK